METKQVKHTPGPWHIEWEPRPRYFNVYKICCDAGPRLAEVPALSLIGEDEANARLIAAAPDLLHELKRASHALGLVIGTAKGRYSEAEIEAIIGYKRLADEQIAKAEGGEE